MSVENPPTYNFNGINFNPSFYIDNNTITKEEVTNGYIKNPINNSTGLVNNILTLTNTSPIQTSWMSSPTQISDYVRFNPTTNDLSRLLNGSASTISLLTVSTFGSSTAQRFGLPTNSSTAPADYVLSINVAGINNGGAPSTIWKTIPTQISDYLTYNTSTFELSRVLNGTPTIINQLTVNFNIGRSTTQKFSLPANCSTAPAGAVLSILTASGSAPSTQWVSLPTINDYTNYNNTNKTLISNVSGTPTTVTNLVLSNGIGSSLSQTFKLPTIAPQFTGLTLRVSSLSPLQTEWEIPQAITPYVSYDGTNLVDNTALGSSNITSLAVSSLGSQSATITINCPISPGYLSNPVNIFSLGGVKENNITATNVQSGTPISVASMSAQLGVYQVFYQIKYTITVSSIAFTQQRVCLCDTINAINTVYNQMETLENQSITRPLGNYIITGGGVWINNVSAILSPIYLNVSNTFTAGPTLSANAYLRIVRIG